MSLTANTWTALGSIFTAVAAFVALGVGIVPYRQQNRLSRATALRGLVRTVLHDSQDIFDMTVYVSSVIPEAQVRAFRRMLGESATADDLRTYFFDDGAALAGTSFIAASLDSSAYSRLTALWNDIDRTSAELRGSLRILYDAAALIVEYSKAICFPKASIGVAVQMAGDDKLRVRCGSIKDIDKLELILSYELTQRLHGEPYNSEFERLGCGKSFVESLANTIRGMKDGSLRDLASESIMDWPEFLTPELLPHRETPAIGRAYKVVPGDPEKTKLDDIGRLIKQLRRKIPGTAVDDLEEQFIKWRDAYNK